ncbi:MAG TPA: SRPBCC domain-containing protein [Cyclobacteriaceae bacterium]|nr:SRPBCC domain-containing protein [Cyclobacteriaceae bacterium]
MEHLEYKVVISAPARKVWETMLGKETYKQWVAKSWPDSNYEGKWTKGENIRFIGPDGSGTLAEIVELKPYEKVFVRHVAVLNTGGAEDRTSDVAKGWIGTTEEYVFTEKQGETTLTVNMKTTADWRKMFDDGWPAALKELKSLSERQLEAVK